MDGSGRVAAVEVLINTPTIRKLIEENKAGGINKVMEESANFYGMQTFNQALFNLVKDKHVSPEEALGELKEARRSLIDVLLERGDFIPEPRPVRAAVR